MAKRGKAVRGRFNECKKCGYIWESMVVMPKACPKCKRYTWNDPEPEKKEAV